MKRCPLSGTLIQDALYPVIMPTPHQNLAPIIHFLMTYGAIILMCLLAVWTFWPEDKPTPKRQTPQRKPFINAPRRTIDQRATSANARLAPQSHKLRSLLHGDVKQAERIIGGLRSRYPGKSEQWLYEKAILDLERDRRC